MIFDFTCYLYTERILFSILSLFIKLIKSRVFLYLYCTNRTIYKTNNLYTHTHTFCFFSQRVESNELIHPLSINSLFPFFYHGRDSSVQRRFPHSWIKPVTCFLRYYSTVKTRIPLCRMRCYTETVSPTLCTRVERDVGRFWMEEDDLGDRVGERSVDPRLGWVPAFVCLQLVTFAILAAAEIALVRFFPDVAVNVLGQLRFHAES